MPQSWPWDSQIADKKNAQHLLFLLILGVKITLKLFFDWMLFRLMIKQWKMEIKGKFSLYLSILKCSLYLHCKYFLPS